MGPKRSKQASLPSKKAKLDSAKETGTSVPKSKTTSAKCKTPNNLATESESNSVKSGADASSACTETSFLSQFLTEDGWKSVLQTEMLAGYFKKMEAELQQEYEKSPSQIFPPKELIFNALNMTPFDQVKIVILGQDPYHDDGQAHGLSFSVPKGFTVPPSLQNIYKELANDIPGFKHPKHGCLESWANKGILLLNAALTVRAHQPNSHAKIGWHQFTDAIVSAISKKSSSGRVFILWGGFAQKKKKLIDTETHRVINAAHPSPLSFNKFFGCKCFSAANEALQQLGHSPIDWSL